jgi:DNA invertase Pin-like site-specific DNA recombinase
LVLSFFAARAQKEKKETKEKRKKERKKEKKKRKKAVSSHRTPKNSRHPLFPHRIPIRRLNAVQMAHEIVPSAALAIRAAVGVAHARHHQ